MPRRNSSKPDVSGASLLSARYPNINTWVFGGGWIEIGPETYGGSFVRALDEGGVIWEGKRMYKSLEDALSALDKGIGQWMQEQGID